ncbi:MAG: PIN domain-containing protein [Pirellulales bacterium]
MSRVLDWLRKHDPHLVVSPIILGELEFGILLLPAGRKRTKLLQWFAAGVQQLNVVDFDSAIAGRWAQLLAELRRNGRAMPIKDSLIAAAARQHQLTIATRNVAHFQHAGVQVVNPFR